MTQVFGYLSVPAADPAALPALCLHVSVDEELQLSV